jgi:hypothetical protein
VGFDLVQLGYTAYYRYDPASGSYFPVVVWNLPRFLVVETVAGTTIKAPFVWWRNVSSQGYWNGWTEGCPPDAQQCTESIETSTSLSGRVFFGDGDGDGFDWKTGPLNGYYEVSAPLTGVRFTPTQGVAGYSVGTREQSGDLSCLEGTCNPAGSCSASSARVFADLRDGTLVWNKNEFGVNLDNGTVVRKPAGTCGTPWPAANVPDPPLLPELRFRRDYLPADQSLFQEFGVVPPDYQITLR